MDVEKTREELLNELQGLKEELACLKETASGYRQKYTDHKQTETELIKMINLESIGTLAAGIAHDFNNLLMASHGIEAIELYRREKESGERFEAAILDLTVKNGMGGKETLKELIYIDPDIKAIISSGYTDDPVIGKFHDYGFIGAITKPYKAKELKELLEKVIQEEAR